MVYHSLGNRQLLACRWLLGSASVSEEGRGLDRGRNSLSYNRTGALTNLTGSSGAGMVLTGIPDGGKVAQPW